MSKLTDSVVKEVAENYMKYQNYSERSIEHMKKVLKYFNIYLSNETMIKDYRDVKEDDFYRFIEYIKLHSKKEILNITLKGYGIRIKRIFHILEEEEKIIFNPFGDVVTIKAPKNIRDKILSEDEINRLLNAVPLNNPIGFRDRTILEVLYGTGIRASELFNLELQDFIKDEKLLFIRLGKGRKDRIMPLGTNTNEYLLKYVEKIRPELIKRKDIKYIFANLKSRKLNGYNLFDILKKAVLISGIGKKVNPHMIRHTFATHLLNHGADIREVQLLLGHASLKATEVYLNLSDYHLKEIYEKYHPLENELYFDVYGREGYIFNTEFKTGKNFIKKKKLTIDN